MSLPRGESLVDGLAGRVEDAGEPVVLARAGVTDSTVRDPFVPSAVPRPAELALPVLVVVGADDSDETPTIAGLLAEQVLGARLEAARRRPPAAAARPGRAGALDALDALDACSSRTWRDPSRHSLRRWPT